MVENLVQLLSYNPSSPLLFNTGLFLVLFVLFMVVYHSVKRFPRLKMIVVILFSLYFYYKSSEKCVFILCGICVSDWLLGLLLGATRKDWMRRMIVGLNVIVNVGMLVYFKYFNLIADAFASIVSTRFDPLDVVLPAGISFFTFRSISYMVDVYRSQLEPCRNLLEYSFFLTFFPPLLAGPVVRAKDMLPQIRVNSNPSREMTSHGLFMIMTGLVKKVVIADYISGNFVDRIFDNPMLYSGFENLIGCVAFTVQLYCDFSGYSDMAIGLALMMGYRFKENFSAPFKSQNPTEFWRRWHISLSTWLRDYLYIPMGGNRKGRFRAYFNQFMTMLIGGLWHGASWMYVIWGAYHGLLLVLHKSLRRIWRIPEWLVGRPEIKALNVTVTFMLVVAGFTLFRASSLEVVGDIFTQIFTDFHLSVAPQFIEGYMMIVVLLAAGFIAHALPRAWCDGAARAYMGMASVWQAVLLASVLFLVVQMRQSDLVPFIYLKY